MKLKFKYPNRLTNKMIAAMSIFLFFSYAPVIAQNTESDWSGEFTLALQGSDGNTQATSTSVGLVLMHNQDFDEENPYRHTLQAGYDIAEQKLADGDKIDTKDQLSLIYHLDYALNDISYVTGAATYFSDVIAGLDSFTTFGVEYRRIVYQSDNHELKLMAGAAQIDAQYTDDEDISGLGGMLGFDYLSKLSDSVTFQQNAETYETSGLAFRQAKTALSYQLGDSSSVALTYDLTFLSDVPEGNDRTDTMTNLKFKFNF